MRGNQCAINSPRFTATSSRGLFEASHGIVFLLGCPCTTASSPAPIPPRLAKGYSLLAENYFNLLSRVSPLFFFHHPSNPFLLLLLLLLFLLLLLLLLLLLEPVEKREIYEDASITMAPRDTSWPMLYRSWSISRLQRVCLVNETRRSFFESIWNDG